MVRIVAILSHLAPRHLGPLRGVERVAALEEGDSKWTRKLTGGLDVSGRPPLHFWLSEGRVRPGPKTPLPPVPGPLAQSAVQDDAPSQPPSPVPGPSAQSPLPEDAPGPSRVFPEGAFPDEGPTVKGPIPGATAQPGIGGLYTVAPRVNPAYDRPGIACGRSPTMPRPATSTKTHRAELACPCTSRSRCPRRKRSPTDLERDKFLTRGLFPGSYLIPGTNTSFKWYGFVRLDGIFDANPIGGTDSFVTAQIPVPQGRGQNFAANPRYSRLGMDTWTPTAAVRLDGAHPD